MDTSEPMTLDVEDRRFTFKEKWELHKPLLGRLYLDEKWKLPKIQQYMRSEKDFDAE
jgi:Clr5 domain